MSAWAKIVELCAEPMPEKWEKPSQTKQCNLCKQIKPHSQFYSRQTHSKNALSAKCKPCTIANATVKRQERKAKEKKNDHTTRSGADGAGCDGNQLGRKANCYSSSRSNQSPPRSTSAA